MQREQLGHGIAAGAVFVVRTAIDHVAIGEVKHARRLGIAARFGVSIQFVPQRFKLSRVEPVYPARTELDLYPERVNFPGSASRRRCV
jgi:hypothetical protein